MSDIKASVIIHDKYNNILLQLRDEEPGKGTWVLFGGSVEPEDRDEESAAKREILEELKYNIKNIEFFKRYISGKIEQPIFVVNDVVSLEDLELCEGSDLKFFSPEEIINLNIGFNYKEIIMDYLNSRKK
jgi:8-oxo-dGTP pyrophosphatase MutT (NUDIX family)